MNKIIGVAPILTKDHRYRKPLRDELRYQGYDVSMVGSQRNGDMNDNVSNITQTTSMP